MVKINMTGLVFGKLTVIKENGRSNDGKVKWDCQCKCGKFINVSGGGLRTGDSTSCGCVNSIRLINANTTHGFSHLREYTIWKGMKSRCYNKNEPHYFDYGGRGIIVSERWINSFTSFFEDMGLSPTKTHSIDRIDNDGNYEKSNCYWATKKEQGSNKRNNRVLVCGDLSMILQEWANFFNIPVSTLHSRLKIKSIHQLYAEFNRST